MSGDTTMVCTNRMKIQYHQTPSMFHTFICISLMAYHGIDWGGTMLTLCLIIDFSLAIGIHMQSRDLDFTRDCQGQYCVECRTCDTGRVNTFIHLNTGYIGSWKFATYSCVLVNIQRGLVQGPEYRSGYQRYKFPD